MDNIIDMKGYSDVMRLFCITALVNRFVKNLFPKTKGDNLNLNSYVDAKEIYEAKVHCVKTNQLRLLKSDNYEIFVFPGPRPWSPTMVPGPQFVFTGFGPQFVFSGLGPQFVFTGPALNLFLPALAINLSLLVLRITVKVFYSYSVYLYKLSAYVLAS